MLVHYYKTKCKVSGEDAPLNFKLVYIEFKMTVNQLLFTSIGLISGKPCQIGNGGLQSPTDCLVFILLLDWAS